MNSASSLIIFINKVTYENINIIEQKRRKAIEDLNLLVGTKKKYKEESLEYSFDPNPLFVPKTDFDLFVNAINMLEEKNEFEEENIYRSLDYDEKNSVYSYKAGAGITRL